MFEKGTDQALVIEGLQALPSVGDVAQLNRGRHHHRGGGGSVRSNVCLITLNGTLNGLSVLNILNGFGGL